jgi:hypothetical protein
MSVADVDEWSNPRETNPSFMRSAMILTGTIVAIAAAFCLFAIATEQPGSGGPWGVAAAAAVCLLAGAAAEVLGAVVHRAGSPLAALLAGMALRSTPPLAVCMALALRGGGREHLAFVVYLLTLYLVTLTLDTWWAVQRVAGASFTSHTS